MKPYIWDPTACDKARSMCARHSDEYISNYLGMALGQVRSIRRGLSTRVRGRSIATEGHESESVRWRNDAILGSARLGERIDEVFGRRG